MTHWFKKIIGTTCCMCVLGGCAATVKQEMSSSESMQEQSMATEQDFELQGVDGKTYHLSDYKGKKVYIKFWASWCSICLSSLEETDTLAKEADDFIVLSIVAPNYRNEKNTEDFKKWYQTLGYEHLPVLLDEDGQITQSFSIRAYPSAVLIDTEGNIASTDIGYMPLEDIKAKITKLQ